MTPQSRGVGVPMTSLLVRTEQDFPDFGAFVFCLRRAPERVLGASAEAAVAGRLGPLWGWGGLRQRRGSAGKLVRAGCRLENGVARQLSGARTLQLWAMRRCRRGRSDGGCCVRGELLRDGAGVKVTCVSAPG